MRTSFQLLQFDEYEYFYLSYEDKSIDDNMHPELLQNTLLIKEGHTQFNNTTERISNDMDFMFSEGYTARLSNQISTIKQLEFFVNERWEKLDRSLFRCKVCSFQTNKLSNVKYHTEKHIKGLQLECSFCDQTFDSKNSKGSLGTQIRKHEKSDCIMRR